MHKNFEPMKYFITAALAASTVCTDLVAQNALKKNDPRPNILLIMVDDLGFSDIGPYGSEIQTPNLNKLAAEGVRFKEFYNNSICAPTRASLLTGQYPHKAGVGFFDINLGLPAYQGYLNKESLTIGEVLRANGYSTLISGKWHVGQDSSAWPIQRGFDRFYGFVAGASNYFDIGSYGQAPPVTVFKNNTKTKLKEGEYLTNTITDNAIGFLKEQDQTQKPFFLYVAFNAPHWPLQAPPEDIAKYKGRYDIGWDSLRSERIERQRKLGILDSNQKIADRDPEVPYWNNLTYDQKQLWKAKMEVYAAMVDRVDQNIGRLLNTLKELRKDDNTLVIFLSDNGAQGGYSSPNRKPQRNTGPIGTAGSYDYQEQSWAYVSNAPLRQYKNNMHEGGFSAPFIAWYPKLIKPGTIVQGTGHLIDLAPTFYELAHAKYPASFNNININALPGKSLLPVFAGSAPVVNREGPIFWERAGNRAVRKGKWKIVSTYPAYKWELYNLETDRGETTDLASERTDIVNELSADYFKWAEQTGVVDYEKIKPAPGVFSIPGAEGQTQRNSRQRTEQPNTTL
jgi:arylsulfatase A-like enzyme